MQPTKAVLIIITIFSALTGVPEGFIPDHIKTGSPDVRRTWLHDAVSEVVDRFVMFHDISDIVAAVGVTTKDQPLQRTDLPCRMQSCTKIFKYAKARENHGKKQHAIQVASEAVPCMARCPSEDYKKKHTEARLSFGLFLSSMQDAVKEGDGERLLRLYTIALFYYKAYGHNQYAYSTFLLTLKVNATLSPRLAHSLTWNRFWNGKGGRGKNIPLEYPS